MNRKSFLACSLLESRPSLGIRAVGCHAVVFGRTIITSLAATWREYIDSSLVVGGRNSSSWDTGRQPPTIGSGGSMDGEGSREGGRSAHGLWCMNILGRAQREMKAKVWGSNPCERVFCLLSFKYPLRVLPLMSRASLPRARMHLRVTSQVAILAGRLTDSPHVFILFLFSLIFPAQSIPASAAYPVQTSPHSYLTSARALRKTERHEYERRRCQSCAACQHALVG